MNFKKAINDIVGLNKTILALSFARLADAMGNSILFILIPVYVAKIPTEHIDLSVSVLVGLLISIYGFVTSFCQPLMGGISDALNKRKALIIIGMLIVCAGTLGFTVAENFMHLLYLRVLQGVGIAITIPASLSIITAVSKKESRGGAMGVYSTSRMIGFAIGPVIGGYLQVHYGFNSAFIAGAAFILVSVIMVFLWVNEVKVDEPVIKTKKSGVFDWSLYTPGILTAALATFTMANCFSMVTTLENQFNERLDITAFGFSVAFSMLMVGRLLFQVPLGHLSDKRGRRPFILMGLVLMAISTILMGEVTEMYQMIILRLLQGVAAAGIAAPAFALAADLSSKGGEGRQMSIITMGFALGIAVGPLITGFLVNEFFELPFIVTGAAALVAAALVYKYMPETVET
ncbi:MFS transporter [Fulvivirga sediminis]|uniref:MFS transporter n=1 Tax=Fulvivirga sediminis TaxID=2803949 RepID=A0A937FAR4_9BACT|nr:MFS transporter [Fulvivirga sediminis]MBL3658471.1 MFS transporter [Fulvivirga sediminis]